MQTEFSQQFSSTISSSQPVYFELQTTPGIYIIKSLTFFATQTSSVNAGSLSIVSSPTSIGAGFYYIDSTSEGFAANTIIPVFTPTKQIILNQNYLGVLVKLSAYPGTIYINVSYSFIPTTNPNYSNFNMHEFTVSNTTGASFTGLSTTQATIMKAISVVNSTGTTSTIIPQITTNGVTTPLGGQITVDGFSTYTLSPVIYLSSNQTISFQVTGSVGIIYSYTLDPNA